MTEGAMTLMVAGMVAGTPHQAGASWSVLQWVLGLRELGHEVVLVEEIAPNAVVPAGASLDRSQNARYFLDLAGRFGIDRSSCLLVTGTTQAVGMSYDSLVEAAHRTDCLLNISGTLKDERVLECIPVKAYVDIDPGFTQLWDLQGHDLGLGRHSKFMTVGLSIGAPGCRVPTGGREWITTLPPVTLSHWPAVGEPPLWPFTTVVNWRGYGSIEHEGVLYGHKAHSFRDLFALPGLSGEDFVVACAIDPGETGDLEALSLHRWELVNPIEAAGTADSYRRFVGSSLAELNVAKSGYVRSRCGWFSDRSACYLASGRPVVAQDTGFGQALPVGEGFLTFSTVEEAAAAVLEVKESYPRHCKVARLFAEELLDSGEVLGRVLEEVLR